MVQPFECARKSGFTGSADKIGNEVGPAALEASIDDENGVCDGACVWDRELLAKEVWEDPIRQLGSTAYPMSPFTSTARNWASNFPDAGYWRRRPLTGTTQVRARLEKSSHRPEFKDRP